MMVPQLDFQADYTHFSNTHNYRHCPTSSSQLGYSYHHHILEPETTTRFGLEVSRKTPPSPIPSEEIHSFLSVRPILHVDSKYHSRYPSTPNTKRISHTQTIITYTMGNIRHVAAFREELAWELVEEGSSFRLVQSTVPYWSCLRFSPCLDLLVARYIRSSQCK